MTVYQSILVLKLLGVMGFAGGAVAAFIAPDVTSRKRAVHRVGSPSLLMVWLCGYALLLLNGWPMFELWIVGSLLLSVLANAALAFGAAQRGAHGLPFLAALALVVSILVLMVLKPRWAHVSL